MSSPVLSKSPAPTNPVRQQLDELDALLQRMLALPVNQSPEPERNPLPEAQLPIPVPRPRPKLPTPLEPPTARTKPGSEETPSVPPRTEEKAEATTESLLRRTEEARGGSSDSTPLRQPGADFVRVTSSPEVYVPEASSLSEKKSTALSLSTEPNRLVVEPNPLAGWGPSFQEKAPAVVEPESVKPAEPVLLERPSPFLERHAARLQKQRRAAPWLGPLTWVNAAFDRCVLAMGRPGLLLVRAEGRDILGWLGIGLLVAATVILIGDWFGWTW
jgi:hypothetical protein